MGADNRTPTISELNKMKSLVWRAMTDGAVGFSTAFSTCRAPTRASPRSSSWRASPGTPAASTRPTCATREPSSRTPFAETIRVGEAGGCRIQISHLKVDSPSRWGASANALDIIDAARARGVVVEADRYAYTAASSTLGIRFPSWVLEGGHEKMAVRLNDPAMWSKIKAEMGHLLAERGLQDLSFAVVASYAPDPSFNGLSMKQIASRTKGGETADAQFEAAREMMLAGGASMVYHFMSDDDVVRIMKHPFVGIASDSSALTFGDGAPHPRGYGNNARVLGEYVRQRHVITLEEAVRKMTSLPAQQFRFADRGLIKTGYHADLVVFDLNKVGDAATFERPHAYATGIPYVLVNGVPVVRSGDHTGALAGQVLVPEGRKN